MCRQPDGGRSYRERHSVASKKSDHVDTSTPAFCTGPIAVLRRGKHLQQGADTDCGEAGGDVTVVSGNFHETIGLGVEMDAGVAYVGDLSGETRAVNLDGGGETLLVKTKAA